MAHTHRILSLVTAVCLGASPALADSTDGTRQFLVRADLATLEKRSDESADLEVLVRQSIQIIERRFAMIEPSGVEIIDLGDGRLQIDVPATVGRDEVEDVLGIPPDIALRVADPASTSCPSDEDGLQGDPDMMAAEEVAGKAGPAIGGDYILGVLASFDGRTGRPVVSIAFDDVGTRQLAALTTGNVGKCMQIVLDGSVIFSGAILEPVREGRIQLSGIPTDEDAQNLAIRLHAGALPAPFEIVDERGVD